MSSDSTDASFLAADDEAEPTDDRSRMTFLEHLDELRRRILYSLYVMLACCGVTFFFWEPLYRYYVHYFSAFGGHLVYTQPMAGFMFSMKLSALAAFLVAAPFVFSQAWLFVAPGLYAKEKKVVVPFVFFASIFFFTGAYFAHRIAFPSMWQFFAGYQMTEVPAASGGIPAGDGSGLTFLPDLDITFSFYVKTLLGMGLVFQMPMVVFFLARFGIVTAKFMLKQFKYAVLVIVILAAIITPSGDPVNLTIFSAPMLFLYIVSIGVAWVFGKKRPVAEPAE
ncbi:MAG: twin-arginine translocase subunit TatC [Acidobacteriota bacterium]